MDGLVTESGRNGVSELLVEYLSSVAVGTDGAETSPDDDTLGNEIHRESTSSPEVSITADDDVGSITVKFSVTGGSDVPAGTSVREIGLFFGQTELFYRRSLSAVVISAGVTQTFSFSVDVVSSIK